MKLKITLLFLAFLSVSEASANVGGPYAPILESGLTFHTGEETNSLSGASSYYLNFRAEGRKSWIRPQGAGELQFGSGTGYLSSAQTPFTLYGGNFAMGFHVFPFSLGRIQPFVGVNGLFGWNLLRLGSAPTGVSANTNSLVFGYELDAGVDIRFRNNESNALRIRTAFRSSSGSLAGQSGFILSGFRIGIGIVF